jgi:hypothetical protein
MNDKRGPWFLITGIILGIGIGLFVAWVVSPVAYVDTAPASLRSDYKNQYRRMIALAFSADKDIGRARQRLTLLQDADSIKALSSEAQQVLAAGGSVDDARALAVLASALTEKPTDAPGGTMPVTPTGGSDPATATLDASQSVLTATPQAVQNATPEETFTPRPTSVVQPTLGSPFYLVTKDAVCDPKLPQGLLQVQINNSAGQPADGLRIHVSWNDGEDYFYTGLMPEFNPGYAEFTMKQGKIYSVQVGEGGEPVNDLSAQECTNADNSTYLGGWKLEFGQH